MNKITPKIKIKKSKLIILFSLIFLVNSALAKLTLERKLSLGGNWSGGNTDSQALHADFLLNRNEKWRREVSVKGSFDKESTAGVDTKFNLYGRVRYGHSISRQLYDFVMLEGTHDRFQDIKLRVVPTIGLGYWFIDQPALKANVEAALGYQKEYLLSSTAENDSFVLRLSSDFKIGALINEFDLYTAVSDLSNFRLTNTLNYKLKLSNHYALKWTLKESYNNIPAAGVLKNDLSFLIAIEYAFKKVL